MYFWDNVANCKLILFLPKRITYMLSKATSIFDSTTLDAKTALIHFEGNFSMYKYIIHIINKIHLHRTEQRRQVGS